MAVGIDDRVDIGDTGVQKLLAHVGRRVDQNGGFGVTVNAFDQQRAASAGVFRVIRVAIAPKPADPGHTTGRAAAKDGEDQFGHDVTLENSVSKFVSV